MKFHDISNASQSLQDILTLYTSLESNIQNRWIDETDILTMLAEKIGESKILRNAVIYIDEFSGFTPQEYAVITALMKVAKKMMITITTDTLLAEFEEENNLFALNKITAKKDPVGVAHGVPRCW